MKSIKLSILVLVVLCCTGCANWFNQQFGFLASEITEFSVNIFDKSATILSWDPVEGIDEYYIYVKDQLTGEEQTIGPLNETSYCLPYGLLHSFAVSMKKGDVEKKTDFITPTNTTNLMEISVISPSNPVILIPSASNIKQIEVAFDDSSDGTILSQDRKIELNFSSELYTEHHFTIKYTLNDNTTVTSAPYYYSYSSLSTSTPLKPSF